MEIGDRMPSNRAPTIQQTGAMAVTLQLARLTNAHLAKCRTDVDALEEICSFKALSSDSYADLDWAGNYLDNAAVTAGIPAGQAESLSRATGDGLEVNAEYDGTWDPPRYWSSAEVRQISTELDHIDAAVLLDEEVISSVFAGGGVTDPLEYMSRHFKVLREFYRTAAALGLVVMLWGD
jgi:hypothetical protein